MRHLFGLFLTISTICLSDAVAAQSQNCRQEFLEIAEGICGEYVALSGSSQSNSADISINAKINGLLGRLVDLGGEARAGRETEYFENIKQADLPKVLNQGAQCRLEVTRLLFDKICGPTATALRPASPATPTSRTWLLARQSSDAPGCELQPVAANGVLPPKIKLNRGVYFWTVTQNGATWCILRTNGTYHDLNRSCFALVGTFGPNVPLQQLTRPARLKPSLGYACAVLPKPLDDGTLLGWARLVEGQTFHTVHQQGNHWYTGTMTAKSVSPMPDVSSFCRNEALNPCPRPMSVSSLCFTVPLCLSRAIGLTLLNWKPPASRLPRTTRPGQTGPRETATSPMSSLIDGKCLLKME